MQRRSFFHSLWGNVVDADSTKSLFFPLFSGNNWLTMWITRTLLHHRHSLIILKKVRFALKKVKTSSSKHKNFLKKFFKCYLFSRSFHMRYFKFAHWNTSMESRTIEYPRLSHLRQQCDWVDLSIYKTDRFTAFIFSSSLIHSLYLLLPSWFPSVVALNLFGSQIFIFKTKTKTHLPSSVITFTLSTH